MLNGPAGMLCYVGIFIGAQLLQYRDESLISAVAHRYGDIAAQSGEFHPLDSRAAEELAKFFHRHSASHSRSGFTSPGRG